VGGGEELLVGCEGGEGFGARWPGARNSYAW
jgi:hypothetical protein